MNDHLNDDSYTVSWSITIDKSTMEDPESMIEAAERACGFHPNGKAATVFLVKDNGKPRRIRMIDLEQIDA